jgi:transcriptional regulator with AAA-type ATPase domain
VRLAFWSKQPLAFNRSHVPLARRIAYLLGLRASNREVGRIIHRIDDERAHRPDAGVQRGLDRVSAASDRPSDIVPPSETFLQEIGRSFGRPPAALMREPRHALLEYHWPGNVRELRNVLERATILSDGALIGADHLALHPARSSRNDTTDLGALERTTIAKVLRECRGNKTRAAWRLGLTRTQLHLRSRKYGLEEAAAA